MSRLIENRKYLKTGGRRREGRRKMNSGCRMGEFRDLLPLSLQGFRSESSPSLPDMTLLFLSSLSLHKQVRSKVHSQPALQPPPSRLPQPVPSDLPTGREGEAFILTRRRGTP